MNIDVTKNMLLLVSMLAFSFSALAVKPNLENVSRGASDVRNSDKVVDAIRDFIEQQLVFENKDFAHTHISIALDEADRDSRHSVQLCEQPIQVAAPRPDKGWITLKGKRRFMLSCGGGPAVSYSADILFMQYQWVANQVIERGSLLTDKHVSRLLKPISLNRLAPKQVIGQSVSRRIRQGQVIQSSQLQAPVAIIRGQKVRLLAQDGIVQSVLEGEAVTEGAVGETIRVRNSKSKVILEGVIRDNQTVEVLL